jgi:TPR repeat protein
MINKILKTILFFSVLTNLSYADFQKGLEAYKKEDYKIAIKEFTPLAEQGNLVAQFGLGHIYSYGAFKNDKLSAKWHRKAAEQGDAVSQSQLGLMYSLGNGVLKNDKLSAKWHRKAAEQDNAVSQLMIGVMYGSGIGVLKDMSKQKYWVNKAYENDDANVSQKAKIFWDKHQLWKY